MSEEYFRMSQFFRFCRRLQRVRHHTLLEISAAFSFLGLHHNSLTLCETIHVDNVTTSPDQIGCRETVTDIRSWTRQQGIVVSPNVTISRSPIGGLGLICGKKVRSGEILVTVPASSIMSAEHLQDDRRYEHIIAPLRRSGLDARGVLALGLVLGSLEYDNMWKDYLKCLPTMYELSKEHPLLSRDIAPSTAVGVSVHRMRKHILNQLRGVLRAHKALGFNDVLSNARPSDLEELWCWAHAIVLSRSGIKAYSNETGRSDESDSDIFIIPYVDFCNHAENPTAYVTESRDGSMQLVAEQDMAPGDEITISYWPRHEPLTCEQSLFSFGFCSNLKRFAIPGIDVQPVDDDPRKAVQRLLFLDRRMSKDDFIYLDSLDLGAEYFAIAEMTEREFESLVAGVVKDGKVSIASSKIFQPAFDRGRLRLLSHLTSWRNDICDTTYHAQVLSEYICTLRSALDDSIRTLAGPNH